jgi:hypothetical protein
MAQLSESLFRRAEPLVDSFLLHASTSYVHAAVKILAVDRFTQLSGIDDKQRLRKVRSAFISWAHDFGYAFENVWTAWDVFWPHFRKLNPSMKTTLNSEDSQRYHEALADLRHNPVDELTGRSFTPLLLTQVFSKNGAYLGAWFSCTINYDTYFWIFFNDEWEITVFGPKQQRQLQRHVLDLAGLGGYYYSTYHAIDPHDLIISGEWSSDTQQALFVGAQ